MLCLVVTLIIPVGPPWHDSRILLLCPHTYPPWLVFTPLSYSFSVVEDPIADLEVVSTSSAQVRLVFLRQSFGKRAAAKVVVYIVDMNT